MLFVDLPYDKPSRNAEMNLHNRYRLAVPASVHRAIIGGVHWTHLCGRELPALWVSLRLHYFTVRERKAGTLGWVGQVGQPVIR